MSGEERAASELVLYRTEDGRTRIQCRFEEGTIWLSQERMAELFQKDVRTINEHLQNIFDEGELAPEATIRRFRIVRTEGNRSVTRHIQHYSLPAILAVGFRVRSPRGTEFRRWANDRLDEYLRKGFVLDDERLKTPPGLARASADAPNMGLTSWKGAAVRKGDIKISKNYLRAEEIEELNRIVVMFLDYAEDQARRRRQVFMHDWREKLDGFLRFNERDVLPDAGAVERRLADAHADDQYERFAARRRAVREGEGADALAEVASKLERAEAARAAPPRRKRRGEP